MQRQGEEQQSQWVANLSVMIGLFLSLHGFHAQADASAIPSESAFQRDRREMKEIMGVQMELVSKGAQQLVRYSIETCRVDGKGSEARIVLERPIGHRLHYVESEGGIGKAISKNRKSIFNPELAHSLWDAHQAAFSQCNQAKDWLSAKKHYLLGVRWAMFSVGGQWSVPCDRSVTRGYLKAGPNSHSTSVCEASFKKAFSKLGCVNPWPNCFTASGQSQELRCQLEVTFNCQRLPLGQKNCLNGFRLRTITWNNGYQLRLCQLDNLLTRDNIEKFLKEAEQSKNAVPAGE